MRHAIAVATILAAALVGASAHAAAILYPFPDQPTPPNTLRIELELVDVTRPSEWLIKSPTGPNPPLDAYTKLTTVNTNPMLVPPVWEFIRDVAIDRDEALFLWKPNSGLQFAYVNVAEFVAAGDGSIVMRVDSDKFGGDWHIITWESPNLGVVTRTYERTPEPTCAVLLVLAALVLRRRRK